MNKIYLIKEFVALGSKVIAAFQTKEDAIEIYIDLVFEQQYETFLYYLSLEDIYDYMGGYDYLKESTEVELALAECKFENDYIIEEVPYFGTFAPYC